MFFPLYNATLFVTIASSIADSAFMESRSECAKSGLYRGKWGNAGQGVMPDNAVVANRATVAIFHYPVVIAT